MSAITPSHPSQAQAQSPGSNPDNAQATPFIRQGLLEAFNDTSSEENRNFVCVGGAGSGKHFVIHKLAFDTLSKGGTVRLIDSGQDYRRFCQALAGQHLELNPDNPVSLNPFSGLKSKEDLQEKIPLINELLKQTANSLTPEKETLTWQYACIEEAAAQALASQPEGIDLTHVRQELLKSGDAQALDAAVRLDSILESKFQPWFIGNQSAMFDNPFVVIETEKIRKDPKLQTVVTTLLMHHISKEMYLTDRTICKMLCINEAWDLLAGVSGKFVERLVQQAPSYRGFVGAITLSFVDFQNSNAAKAVLDNVEWKFLLRQRVESLNEQSGFDEEAIRLIKNLEEGRGFFDVFVRNGNIHEVHRLTPDAQTQFLFSNNPSIADFQNSSLAKVV